MRRSRTAPTRAGRSGATGTKTRKPPQSIPQRPIANWASAQIRTARYRTVTALRMAVFAVIGLAGLSLIGLALTGGLGPAGEAVRTAFADQLTRSGYVVRAVDVAGAIEIEPSEIARVIGAEPGRGLIEIDPAEARAAIEAMSRVDTARVMRLWPDRISVIIVERAPYALWQNDGVHYVIDRRGIVLTGENPADHTGLPRLVGAGANDAAEEIVSVLARQPELASLVTHAVRVGERRWNLRLASGSDILLPETGVASAVAMIAALHADQRVLDLDAQAFDLRAEGEMAVRAWPERVSGASARERGA
ncbi:MAG: cell division protein FtsQ/DivIB [Caulobacterales bacterium]|uniref:cell division protein FtsQ/DivIB n=1 Tax=Glycocaulis sp. TaxID=1969725 RepID=UPI003F9F5572